MNKMQDVFIGVQEMKKKQRELRSVIREAYAQSGEYQDIVAELKAVREKKKTLERQIIARYSSEIEQLERIKGELKEEHEKLISLALSHLAKGETIKVLDSYNNTYDPILKISFRRSDDQRSE